MKLMFKQKISRKTLPKKASDFKPLPEFDYRAADGHFTALFSLCGRTLLLTLVGTADSEEDLALFKHIDRLYEAYFSDGNPFYLIIDTTLMQPLGLEVRRTFINRTLGGIVPKRAIMFGLSQALMTMIQLGQRISPTLKQLELASDIDEALKLLARGKTTKDEPAPPASHLNDREQELLTALSGMIWNSDYEQRLQQLEPDDPFVDLYHAVASLQRDFLILQESNVRSRQALTQANIKLTARVKEKTQQLSQTEENYQLVVESASDGIVILDEGVVRYANPQMLAMVGYAWDEVFGQPVERFTSLGAQRAIEEMAVRHHAGENINTRRDTTLINKQGEPVPVEIQATLMPYEEQTTILAFVRDITNRKRMEQAEKDARVLAETLRDAGTILSSTLDRKEVINRVISLAQRLVPYDVCEVFIVDEKTSSLKRIFITDPAFDDYLVMPDNTTYNIAEWPTYRSILETGKPIIVSDSHNYSDWVWVEDNKNVACWMGVPLVIRDKVIAIISLYIDKTNFYTQDHFKNVQLFAQQANLALENAWLFEEATQRIKELSILNDIGDALANTESIPDIFETIYQKIRAIFDVDNFSVIIYHVETDEYSILYWMRDGKHQPVERRKVDFPPLLGVMKERHSLFIKTREAYLAYPGVKDNWYRDLAMESWMGAPLTSSGKVVGVISTLTRDAGKAFTDEDFALFNIIGSQVSAAIEKERLRKETEDAAVAQERQRLARDLHDSVSQLLYSQVLYGDAARKTMTAGQTTQALDYMRQMTDASRQALREMRLMIYELRPQALQEHGLEQAINNRLEQVERRTGINARLNCLLACDLPLDVETELYYIIIEALNNAIKHARAENIHINLYQENNSAVLQVIDDGMGFEPGTGKAGIGLKSMCERAEKLGGSLDIQSDMESGTTITVRFVCKEENV